MNMIPGGTRPGSGGVPKMPDAAPAAVGKVLGVKTLDPLTTEWADATATAVKINGTTYDLSVANPNLGESANRLGKLYLETGVDTYGTVTLRQSSRHLQFYVNTGGANVVTSSSLSLYDSAGLGMRLIGGDVGVGHDTPTAKLDVAGNISLRNGLTSTNLLLYGTYTDASNYERLRAYSDGTRFYLSSEAVGTGALRDIRVNVGSTSRHFQIDYGLTEGWRFFNTQLENKNSSIVVVKQSTGSGFNMDSDEFWPINAGMHFGRSSTRWGTIYAQSVDASSSGSFASITGDVGNKDDGGNYWPVVSRVYSHGSGKQTVGIKFLTNSDVSYRWAGVGARALGGFGGDPGLSFWTVAGLGSTTVAERMFLHPDGRLVTKNSFALGSDLNSPDIYLTREAAGQLVLRNGLNPQSFAVYGTYTDSLNYERLRTYYDGTYHRIASEAAGTGAVHSIKIAAGSTLRIAHSGSDAFSFHAGGLEFLSSSFRFRQLNGRGFFVDDGGMYPTSTSLAIGKSANRWANVWTASLNASSTVTLSGIPTADPLVVGQVWNDGGTLKISAG